MLYMVHGLNKLNDWWRIITLTEIIIPVIYLYDNYAWMQYSTYQFAYL
jgi:hypothetical protein